MTAEEQLSKGEDYCGVCEFSHILHRIAFELATVRAIFAILAFSVASRVG